jgi:tetratricopeptide (TPR) repeat protein
MIRHFPGFVASILAAFLAFACVAGEDPPDVTAELAAARKAWNEGDRLGNEATAAQGDADKVLKIYDQQESSYQQAEAQFRAALKKDPEQPQVLIAYGKFAIARNDYRVARVRLDHALQSPRAKTLLKPAELAEVMRTLGGLAERAGDVNGAVLYYRDAAELCPSEPRNRLALALAFCASGRSEKAIPVLKTWSDDKAEGVPVNDVPLRALGVYTLAVAEEETSHYEDAIAAYEKSRELAAKAGAAETTGISDHAAMAVERLNDFFDGLQERKAEREKENKERAEKKLKPLPDEREEMCEAQTIYDEGLDLKEKVLQDQSFVTALARARDENAEQADRDALNNHPTYDRFQAAINRFNLALAKYPRLPQACYQLGLCHLLSGNYKDARRTLETALAYSPYNFAALNLLGEVLLESGQSEQAVQTFKKVLAQFPDSGPAHFGLGRAYFYLQRSQRECETALKELDRAEELGLRDKRLYSTQILIRKDGTKLEGRVREKDGDYFVDLGDKKPVTVAKADVQELTKKLGLRDKLLERIARFERGEPAAHGPVLHGKNAPHGPSTPDPVVDPWGQKY